MLSTLTKGSLATELGTPSSNSIEVCPECGQFVDYLHEESGWCIPCSKELGFDITRRDVYYMPPTNAREKCFNGHPLTPGSFWDRGPRGIKCKLCDRESARKKRKELKKALFSDPDDPRHGSKSGVRTGCVCAKCEAGREAYNARRRVLRREDPVNRRKRKPRL